MDYIEWDISWTVTCIYVYKIVCFVIKWLVINEIYTHVLCKLSGRGVAQGLKYIVH